MTSDAVFNGRRLAVARAFQGWTQKALADRVSVSIGLLSQFENNFKKPSGDLEAALAQALYVRPEFFGGPLQEDWTEADCSFRRRVATAEAFKRRARAHGTLMTLVVAELASKVRFPSYAVPAARGETLDEIERASIACREQWKLGLGPISQIGRVAEHNGIVLVKNVAHADKIDAFARRGRFPMIVLNTAKTSSSRWIFDVAHELGHFVLHEGVETGSKATEDQANNFASAFLLPRQTFGREFSAKVFGWAHVFELKRRWNTSAAAIVRRAYSLSLLDAIAYRRAYQYMSVKGWLKAEPHEPKFVGPEWLPSAFQVASERFGLTPAVLCERTKMTPQLFAEVTGVEVARAAPVRLGPRLVS